MIELPAIDEVFFVHYQCDNFEEGVKIYSLCIYAKNYIEVFDGDEIKAIEDFCSKVESLCKEGLIPVHWGQNKPHFGVNHIMNRYQSLVNKAIELDYTNSINLSKYLVLKYGKDYIKHPKLDALAELNNFNGIRKNENGKKVFPTNRINLIAKIYLSVLQGNLKFSNPDNEKEVKKITTKTALTSYNWTGKPEELIELHRKMKGVLIDKKTEMNDFCNIFKDANLVGIRPVKWLRSTTDLLQFLYEMMDAGLIKNEIKYMNYKRLQACFIKLDSSKFDESFRSIFQQIKNGITTEKNDIKELVKKFI